MFTLSPLQNLLTTIFFRTCKLISSFLFIINVFWTRIRKVVSWRKEELVRRGWNWERWCKISHYCYVAFPTPSSHALHTVASPQNGSFPIIVGTRRRTCLNRTMAFCEIKFLSIWTTTERERERENFTVLILGILQQAASRAAKITEPTLPFPP